MDRSITSDHWLRRRKALNPLCVGTLTGTGRLTLGRFKLGLKRRKALNGLVAGTRQRARVDVVGPVRMTQ